MKTLAIAFHPGFADRRPASRGARPPLLRRIMTWRRVARERRQLLSVDPRLLADMGLSPEQASHEASRPFWDVDPIR